VSVDLQPFERHITTICSRATAKRYGIVVHAFLRWLARENQTLSKASRDALSRYANSLLEQGYLPGTVQAHLAGINRYTRWLDTQGVVIPEFFRAELPRQKRRVRDALTPEHLRLYLQLANELDEPLRTAVMLFPCTGLRSNEMATLKLNTAKRVPFRMGNGLTEDKTTLRVRGKGGDERVVPVLDEGVQILRSYFDRWRKYHSDTQWLFPGRYTSHISTRSLREAVQKIRKPLQMTFTPHTMRRTYLTSLYRQGVEPVMLAKIAGHADVKILMDHYLALDETDIVKAVHSVGGKLRK
jgi:site-specific recombinase XerD